MRRRNDVPDGTAGKAVAVLGAVCRPGRQPSGRMIGAVGHEETFCERCLRVGRKAVAGLCVGCFAFVAAPATGVTPVAGPLPGQSAIYSPPGVTAEGPHNPELPFSDHVPSAEYGGVGTTVTFTGNVR